MSTSRRFCFVALFVMITLASLGCGESNPANSFEPRVTNTEDDFVFQASNIYLVTTRLDYDWFCSGQTASVEHSSGRSNGSGTLFILDADGNQIYQSAFKSSITEITLAGTPGDWKVVVDLTEYSGSIYFRLRKL